MHCAFEDEFVVSADGSGFAVLADGQHGAGCA